MIRPQHIDHARETAPQLLAVVRNVGQEIGGVAARLDQHTVPLEPEILRSQPHGSVRFVDEAGFAQIRQSRIDLSISIEGVLIEVHVEVDTELRQRALDVGEDRLLCRRLEAGPIGVLSRITVFFDERPRDLGQILALVPVLRQLALTAQQLLVAGPQ